VGALGVIDCPWIVCYFDGTLSLGAGSMNVVSRLVRQLKYATAEKLSGYEDRELVDVIFKKTKLFRPTERWTEVDGAATVLDFGGGCGIHYAMAQLPNVRWAVVETPAMVDRASEIATDRLRFFADVSEAAAWLGSVDVMHSNGALQYASEPETKLRELCTLGAKTMLWKRVALSDRLETDLQSSLLAHNGPGVVKGIKNKSITYALTRLPESLFLSCHARYRVAAHRRHHVELHRADDFRFEIASTDVQPRDL